MRLTAQEILKRVHNKTADALRHIEAGSTGAQQFPDAAAAADAVTNPTISKVGAYRACFHAVPRG